MEMLRLQSPELRHLRAACSPSPDPALTPFVTASSEEIRYAQELRRRIEERYLGRPITPPPLRSGDAD
jgi:hypothetical protein